MGEYVLGELLKGFRIRAGMTQAELAARSGISRTTISNWERSEFAPDRREDVLKLAEVLELAEAEADQLLEAAGFAREHSPATSSEVTELTVRRARVTQLRVEQLVLPSGSEGLAPRGPSGPLQTRVPRARAGQLVGRDSELDWLCERLEDGRATAILGVRGIGGIGKTELAIAAAARVREHFEGRVIWLDGGANDVRAIQDRLAEAVGVTLDTDNLEVRADRLALTLEEQPRTLVVLDDLRKRHLQEFDLLMPPCPPCALLVTSRRQDLPLGEEAILKLGTIPRELAGGLLCRLAGQDPRAEPEAVARVAELLEYIPLALRLAAARARAIARWRDETKARQPFATLLDELRQRRLQVLHQGGRPDMSHI